LSWRQRLFRETPQNYSGYNMSSIAYKYGKSLYINMTNRCTASCTFCIKNKWAGKFRGNNLRLKKEPTTEQVIREIKNPKKYSEIVFCGYGEPLLRLEELKIIAAWIKSKGGKVRVNTSGHANLVYKRDITPELEGLVDAVSISLNAANPSDYRKLHRPAFGLKSYKAVLNFAGKCKKHIKEVTLTCITLPGTDTAGCAKIAEKLGVNFRLRPYLDSYENS